MVRELGGGRIGAVGILARTARPQSRGEQGDRALEHSRSGNRSADGLRTLDPARLFRRGKQTRRSRHARYARKPHDVAIERPCRSFAAPRRGVARSLLLFFVTPRLDPGGPTDGPSTPAIMAFRFH